MGQKSPDAFRTISEVADWLDTPAHVLRFWESKFSQVKPVKRAGGRRYYRPSDMQLLGGIKKLLHDDGMTIKGAQKLLRENGIRYVCALSPPLDDELERLVAPKRPDKIPSPAERAAAAAADAEEARYAHDVAADEAAASGEVLPFASRGDQAGSARPDSGAERSASATATPPAPQTPVGQDTADAAPAGEAMQADENRLPSFLSKPMTGAGTGSETEAPGAGAEEPVEPTAEAAPEQDAPATASPTPPPHPHPPETAQPDDPPAEPKAAPLGESDTHLPGFLRKPLDSAAEPATPDAVVQDTSDQGAAPDADPAEPATQKDAPQPQVVPDDPAPGSLEGVPGLLSAIAVATPDPARADEIRPLLHQLAALRDRMAAGRRT